MKIGFLLAFIITLLGISGSNADGQNQANVSPDLIYQNGIEAYQSGDYQTAVELLEQACEQTQTNQGVYCASLGVIYETLFLTAPESEKNKYLTYLKKSSEAFQKAYMKKHEPNIRYDAGRLAVQHALERAKLIVQLDLLPVTLEPPQDAQAPPNRVSLEKQKQAAEDSLRQLWPQATFGLSKMWEAILDREDKERFYPVSASLQPNATDTLGSYTSVYVEKCLELVELASHIGFSGINPNYFIPKIVAACNRRASSADSTWYRQIKEYVLFDGGHNMPCAIHRFIAIQRDREDKHELAIKNFDKARRYAQSEVAQADIYLDMAYAVYDVDLEQVFKYAHFAYAANQEPKVRDTYGNVALSLAQLRLDDRKCDEAISYAYPVTLFEWNGREDALILLGDAYYCSSGSNALEKAGEVYGELYKINPQKHWENYLDVLKRLGRYDRAKELESKHSPSD